MDSADKEVLLLKIAGELSKVAGRGMVFQGGFDNAAKACKHSELLVSSQGRCTHP